MLPSIPKARFDLTPCFRYGAASTSQPLASYGACMGKTTMASQRSHRRKTIERLSPRAYLCFEFNFLRASKRSAANAERLIRAARLLSAINMRESKLSKLRVLRHGFDLAVSFYGGIKHNVRFTLRERAILYAASESIESQMKAAACKEMRRGTSTYMPAALHESESD